MGKFIWIDGCSYTFECKSDLKLSSYQLIDDDYTTSFCKLT